MVQFLKRGKTWGPFCVVTCNALGSRLTDGGCYRSCSVCEYAGKCMADTLFVGKCSFCGWGLNPTATCRQMRSPNKCFHQSVANWRLGAILGLKCLLSDSQAPSPMAFAASVSATGRPWERGCTRPGRARFSPGG